LVVERDGGCEGEEALKDPCSEAVEGADTVAFEREEVFEGLEDASLRQSGEQVAEPLAGDRQETLIGRDAHDRLGNTERDDLRVGPPLLAFLAFSGRRSSAVQNTAISSRSRSASIVAPLGRRRG
jgi:hypothetical protein